LRALPAEYAGKLFVVMQEMDKMEYERQQKAMAKARG